MGIGCKGARDKLLKYRFKCPVL